MITKEEAEKLAILWLEEQGLSDIEYIVVTKVFEKPYGYVLTYQDKRYLKHNDKKYLIFGTLPIVVENDGKLIYKIKIPMTNSRLSFYEKIAIYDYFRITLGQTHEDIDLSQEYDFAKLLND